LRISSLSVQVVPPVFGSSLAEIVPPVIMIATFGSFCRPPSASRPLRFQTALLPDRFASRTTLASRISFSLIPML